MPQTHIRRVFSKMQEVTASGAFAFFRLSPFETGDFASQLDRFWNTLSEHIVKNLLILSFNKAKSTGFFMRIPIFRISYLYGLSIFKCG